MHLYIGWEWSTHDARIFVDFSIKAPTSFAWPSVGKTTKEIMSFHYLFYMNTKVDNHYF